MTFSIRRRIAAAVLGVAIAGAGLTACSSESALAARVGDDTITVKEFQQSIDEAYADDVIGEGAKEAGAPWRTQALNFAIQAQIARQVAENENISYDQADIEEFRATLIGDMSPEDFQAQYAASGQFITVEQINQVAEGSLVMSLMGEKAAGMTLEAAQAQAVEDMKAQAAASPGLLDSFSLSLLYPADEATANAWVADLNSGTKTVDQIGAEAGPTPDGLPQPSPIDVTGQQLAQDQLLEPFANAQAGQAVLVSVPGPTGAPAYVVAWVNTRTPISEEELTAQATQTAQEQFSTAGGTAIAEAAKKVDIEVNPRFGSIEFPAQGLPSIADSMPATFTEPAAPSAATPDLSGITG